MPEQFCLEDGLNDAAVIRTTFETLNLFPPDDSICAELQQLISEARENLVRRLQTLRDKIQTEPEAFEVNWEEFRSAAIRIITQGFPRPRLDNLMKMNIFDEGESSLFYFEVEGLVDMEAVRRMPAHQLAALLVNEVLQAVRSETNYSDGHTFDAHVFQKYMALMLMYYVAIAPTFYR
jgi:hypothetical protein